MEYQHIHEDLVEGCKNGCQRSQQSLYDLYAQAMFNICLRMVKQPMDAEDMLQQSFVDVFSKISSFRNESSIGAWIKRIVINNCINHIKRKRIQWEELQEGRHDYADDEDIESPAKYSMKVINEAILALPDGYRIVFSLYLLEGYDHQEIGDILGISEATSKSQFSRAKKKLRAYLTEVKK